MISIVWGGVDYPVTQPYGPNHRGIDIGMAIGTPLYAARAGVIRVAEYWGIAIKVDGTDQTDWYLHISQCGVKVGWLAARGAGLGLSGDTPVPGGPLPTGPHLHFEVQTGLLDVYATSLDPVPILTGTYGPISGSLSGVDLYQKQAWVRMAYVAGLGRDPENVAVRDNWANSIHDDGSNLDGVLIGIMNSAEGLAHRAAIAKAIADVDTAPTIQPHSHAIPAAVTEPT